MGLVHAYKKGDVPASKVSKSVKDAAKSMSKKDTEKYASTKHKGLPNKVKQEINLETLIKENPAAVAAAVQAMQQMKAANPKTGRVNKMSTALSNKKHPSHKKAKSVFSKIVDKFKKKKKQEPKKQSKSDVDFYKKQFTGEVFDGIRELIRIELEGFKSDAQRRAAFASGYKAKGKKKKKESVSEAMDKRQGAEALQQLGGNRFIAMTGAKHFGVGPNGMSFKIGRNSKRVNHVTIDYDRGRDLYNMKFDWVTIKGIKNKKTLKGIYADQLQDMFTKYTGMYTSL